ncbi:organic cation transporter -like, partial [Paramuricea clavata]
ATLLSYALFFSFSCLAKIFFVHRMRALNRIGIEVLSTMHLMGWVLQFVPESSRWLLLKGKKEEAKTVLAKISKMNKLPLPDDLTLQNPVTPETGESFRTIFRSWEIAKKILICWDLWFANALVYYGVSFGSVDLGGNRYLNVFLVSVVEIPSNLAYIWSAHRFGRKKSVIIPMLIAFVVSAISVAIPTNKSSASVAGRVTVAIIAKFFINFSFSGVYLRCAELFPTAVRATAIGTSSAVARLGSFSASYIVWLIRFHAALPYSIMAVICIQAAVFAIFLPETKGVPTLETMDDMNKKEGVALLVNGNGKADTNENEAEPV